MNLNLDNSTAIAVYCSGGDAPGMNAVVRSVVRSSICAGRTVYAIMEGYMGLVKGGDYIKRMGEKDVGLIIQKGGTVIGSARCMEFKERSGRLQAANNLVSLGITNLICCGGDGSLTGANLFKNEWPSLLTELAITGKITQDEANKYGYLNLCGLVGSIDNDMVYDGELTIGTDTALHRIVECADAVMATASSHQRTFVLEVMGRHCGYLAWGAALACEADFVFIPESPPSENWVKDMCKKLERRRKLGKRMNLIIVAEGAIDRHGNPITSQEVCRIIEEKLNHDTRVTVLGHVQRGGNPSAYDRLLGTICGAAAVETVMSAKNGDSSLIIGLRGSEVTKSPLIDSVANTQKVGQLSSKLDFEGAMKLRGPEFEKGYDYLRAINGTTPKLNPGDSISREKKIGVIHCGAPAGGMNSAVRAIVRFSYNYGYSVVGIRDGFAGLEKGDVFVMDYMSVSSWTHLGGAKLGTNRDQPKDVGAIAKVLRDNNIAALVLVGGFEGLTALDILSKQEAQYPELHIPTVLIPATISNNIPGTEFSLGSDTALNEITRDIDVLKHSADATNKRVFLVETQGGNCGYLATMAALSSGAFKAYTQEEGVTLSDISKDIKEIIRNFDEGTSRQIIVVRNENCNSNYTLKTMEDIYNEESNGSFSVRTLKLGHLCQGSNPSPLDRIRAASYASAAISGIMKELRENKYNNIVLGSVNGRHVFTKVNELMSESVCDTKKRIPRRQWCTNYTNLLNLLHRHDN